MPDIVVSNPGEIHLLLRSLRGADAPASNWHLRLFDNDYVPDKDSELVDFVEATYPGYAPLALTPTTWGDPENPDGTAISFYGTNFHPFPATSGSTTIFGYYLTFDSGAELLWSQRWDAPQVATSISPVLVWAVLSGRSQYSPDPP